MQIVSAEFIFSAIKSYWLLSKQLQMCSFTKSLVTFMVSPGCAYPSQPTDSYDVSMLSENLINSTSALVKSTTSHREHLKTQFHGHERIIDSTLSAGTGYSWRTRT